METRSLTSKIGKRGAVVIPVPLRRRFGIEEGMLMVAEATEEGVLISNFVRAGEVVREADRLFLDVTVLFSAAYRKDAGARRLWQLPKTELVTSSYAAEEARRNLSTAKQRAELSELLRIVRVSNLLADPPSYPRSRV